jgi:hypothetical protein
MSLLVHPGAAALDAYRRALDSGADRETALDVALATLRASSPAAEEWALRTAFARVLDQERRRTARTKQYR